MSDLSQLLDFTADDLRANQDGCLSDRQQARLRRLQGRSALLGGVLVAILILAATSLLFFGQRADSDILKLVGVGATICNAVIVGVLARNWFRVSSDLNAGAVRITAGKVRHTIRVMRRVSTYILQIDDQEFSVSKPVFFAFEEGAAVKVYWSPSSRVLLAAE